MGPPAQRGAMNTGSGREVNQYAERLALLERRIVNTSTAPPSQHSFSIENNASLMAELNSPNISQHSFQFDSPSLSHRSNPIFTHTHTNNNPAVNMLDQHATNSHSNISLLSSSSAKPAATAVGGRRSSVLDVVNQAAEQHMQKVALAIGGPENQSFLSNTASHQTVQTSHRAMAGTSAAHPVHSNSSNSNSKSNTVVQETPNATAVKAGLAQEKNAGGNPRALMDVNATENVNIKTTNQKKATGTKRKSTPVKKVPPAARSRTNSKKTNSAKNATVGNNTSSQATGSTDASRKRTRLHFAENTTTTTSNLSANRSPLSNPSMKALSVSGGSKHQKAPKNNKKIQDFFSTLRKDDNNNDGTTEKSTTGRPAHRSSATTPSIAVPRTPPSNRTKTRNDNSHGVPDLTTPSPYTEMAQLKRKCQLWEQLCQEKDAQLKAVSNNRTILQTAQAKALKQREAELTTAKEKYTEYSSKVNVVVEDLMRKQALADAQRLREQLAADGARLGRIVTTRAGMRSVESWEDGTASRHLQERRTYLMAQRAKLEERQKKVKAAVSIFASGGAQQQQSMTTTNHNNKENGKNQASTTNDNSQVAQPVVEGIALLTKLDAVEALESVRFHLDTVQRKLKELQEEEERLQEEKVGHIRALKRLASEDGSRFRSRPKLHDRYVLMALLGKGGFSEVWKAFDVEDMQEVAVKVHQLDPRWSDDKKENYTKHVSREYEIHRNVRHPRIVSLLDVFEIDTSTFATVLECCNGTDLETVLKQRSKLPEREARAMLLQILSGMNYLSHPSADGFRLGIIHYDIKPGNILFDENGDAKITDFGLSKIVEDHDPGESMELTSQGAGTYWYLPPECFVMEENVAVRISNKVDVWSIGVLYYQMLFGRRPFGHGLSQDRLLSDNTMLNAKEVVFPQEASVSEMGKEFIRDCLRYDQATRPSIGQLCENAYVTTKKIPY